MLLRSSFMNSLRSSSMAHPYLYTILIWVAIADAHRTAWNVALYKPAYQISTNCSCVASRATDGEEFVKFNNSTCSHTDQGQPTTWWMVDLLGVYRIEEVNISNIGDYRSVWLVGFRIDVFTTDPRLEEGFPKKPGQVCYSHNASSIGTGLLSVNCSTPLLGRYVRIIKNNSYALVLCEVMVMTKTVQERYVSYRKRLDTAVGLPCPLKTVQSSSKIVCGKSCTEIRDKCWGFIWFPSKCKCDLLAPESLNSSVRGYGNDGGIVYVASSLVDIKMRGNC